MKKKGNLQKYDKRNLYPQPNLSPNIESGNNFHNPDYINEEGIPRLRCMTCFDFFELDKIRTFDCNDSICCDCLKQYLELKIQSKEVSDEQLICTNHKCKRKISLILIERNVSPECWTKLSKFRLESQNQNSYISCPTCESIMKNDPNKKENIIKCLSCTREFCKKCLKNNDKVDGCKCHQKKEINGLTASTYQVIQDLSNNEETKKNFRLCPKCKNGIEKNGGCNRMVCASNICRGKTIFCFQCGSLYEHKNKSKCKCPTNIEGDLTEDELLILFLALMVKNTND